MGSGGQDEALGHRVRGGPELLANTLRGASALAHIAVDAPGETDFGWSVDVAADAQEGSKLGVVQGQDAFDEHDRTRGDELKDSGNAGVLLEVVDRAVNGATGGEQAHVLEDELAFERIRMIEVAAGACLGREMRKVAVVEVERK